LVLEKYVTWGWIDVKQNEEITFYPLVRVISNNWALMMLVVGSKASMIYAFWLETFVLTAEKKRL